MLEREVKKMKHTNKFISLIMLSSLAISIGYGVTPVFAEETTVSSQISNDNIQKQFIKISFEDRVLYHEEIPTKTMIQIFNSDDEVIKSEVLKSDTDLVLENPITPNKKMFSYWDIQLKDSKLQIKPIMIDKKEFTVSFVADDGGSFLKNNAQTKKISLSADKDTLLKNILPKTSPKTDYKFTGWFIGNSDSQVKNIDSIKIETDNIEYKAKFYPDFNNNDIDDRTEKLKITFETNSGIQLDELEIWVGKSPTLPQLKQKDKVFMGWFKDKEFKDKFTHNDKIIENTVLYAKWEDIKKVVEEAEKKPITDYDISKQVEDVLKATKGTENSSTNNKNTTPNSSTTPSINYQDLTGDSSNSDNEKTSNSSAENGLSVANSSQSSLLDEKKYVFDNKNIGNKYMFKFYDENDKFLFSLVAPYGKTINTLTQNEKLVTEYAVRQDTTIILDSSKMINSDSELLKYNTRTVQKNSVEITEIVPQVKKSKDNNSRTLSDMEKGDKGRISIVTIIIVILFIVAIPCSLLLLKKQKKKGNVNQENKE